VSRINQLILNQISRLLKDIEEKDLSGELLDGALTLIEAYSEKIFNGVECRGIISRAETAYSISEYKHTNKD